MENRTIIGIIDNLNSTSTTDALSANQGRILNEKINNLGIKDISGEDLNEQIGSLIIAYGNDCINRPPGNGFLLNLPHPTAPMRYNRQYWQVRTNNAIYTRKMEDGVWSDWELLIQ